RRRGVLNATYRVASRFLDSDQVRCSREAPCACRVAKAGYIGSRLVRWRDRNAADGRHASPVEDGVPFRGGVAGLFTTPGPDRLAHLFLRLSVGERAVERRRVRHLELTQTAADALLGVLARGLDVDDAVVADHREREGTREARVLEPTEQKRGLSAIEQAPLHDHPAGGEAVP